MNLLLELIFPHMYLSLILINNETLVCPSRCRRSTRRVTELHAPSEMAHVGAEVACTIPGAALWIPEERRHFGIPSCKRKVKMMGAMGTKGSSQKHSNKARKPFCLNLCQTLLLSIWGCTTISEEKPQGAGTYPPCPCGRKSPKRCLCLNLWKLFFFFGKRSLQK